MLTRSSWRTFYPTMRVPFSVRIVIGPEFPEAHMRTSLKPMLLMFMCATAWSASLRELTNADASTGLRQALAQGANQAVSSLGKKDGFLLNKQVRIPLPPRLAKAEKVMRLAGMGAQADDL